MTFGIIGLGNIGRLFLEKVLGLELIDRILVNDKQASKTELVRGFEKVEILQNPHEVCEISDFILLAVKPQDFKELSEKISDVDFSKKVIISPITGVKIQKLKVLKNSNNIARIMPNLPSYIGEGVIAISYSDDFDEKKKNTLLNILGRLGKVMEFNEDKFSALTSFVGSAPGIIFLLIEATVDAGIRLGFSSKQSEEITIQNLIGSAKMIATLRKSPSELKKMVCSPGGTTIEAVYSLERNGIRGGLMEAFFRAFEKAEFFERRKRDE